MKYVYLLLTLVLLAVIIGCTNTSPVSRPVPPALGNEITSDVSYDYSHNTTPKRKYVVIITGDYREYKGDDLPNVDSVGTEMGRRIASDRATISIEERQRQTLELIKYYDNKAERLQDFFDEDPIAMLKTELVNTDNFVVMDEAYAKVKTRVEPRYIVSINLHKAQDNDITTAKCYLSMINIRTGKITASSRGSAAKLQDCIKEASDELKKNLQ